MSLSMYQASAPVFLKSLKAMVKILTKAKDHADARKIDEQAFTDEDTKTLDELGI